MTSPLSEVTITFVSFAEVPAPDKQMTSPLSEVTITFVSFAEVPAPDKLTES